MVEKTMSMVLTTSFATTIELELKRVEARLLEIVSIGQAVIDEKVRALIRAGGKRLRPSLALHSGRMFGADPGRTLVVAAGIELLHTATLVHDDLVDNAAERRGASTLNASLPAGIVVLTGDFLFAQAAGLVSEAEHLGVVQAFARALSEICRGELLQAQSKNTLVSMEDYYQRIYGKTAALFRTAAASGAMLSDASPQQIHALEEYGRLLGMAFQIVDDTLDLTSNAEKLGKPIGHDLREGIVSLPVLIYHAQNRANGTLKRVIAGQASEEQIAAVIQDIRASGAIDQALDIAQDFARQARDALAIAPDGPARQALIEMTYFAVNRDR